MSFFLVANSHTITSPALTLKCTTCLVLELTLTCTTESLHTFNCLLIHSEVLSLASFLRSSKLSICWSVSSRFGDWLDNPIGRFMWWRKLHSEVYDMCDDSLSLKIRGSCNLIGCLISPWLPECAARQESISVKTLSDSKHELLNWEPNDEFLEWYAEDVLEQWNGGKDGVSDTFREWVWNESGR